MPGNRNVERERERWCVCVFGLRTYLYRYLERHIHRETRYLLRSLCNPPTGKLPPPSQREREREGRLSEISFSFLSCCAEEGHTESNIDLFSYVDVLVEAEDEDVCRRTRGWLSRCLSSFIITHTHTQPAGTEHTDRQTGTQVSCSSFMWLVPDGRSRFPRRRRNT